MFADNAKIFIKSGRGGDGHISFRRELFVPAGGPDGGDGGCGGDVIFEVEQGSNTLSEFRQIRKYKAEDGSPGGTSRCHGKDGKDVIIKVPQGTVIKEIQTGKVIADMAFPDSREVILKGGRGGKGNQHYATATMQVPKYAQPGQDGRELEVLLELKMIADVGLVGFPNVGKSTFLASVTNAKPKIANYHFTTLNPNLGVVDLGNGAGYVIADIPGLIEGASEGIGLGHEFLRHIERTKVIIHVVDVASIEGRNPVEDIKIINEEICKYNPEILKRPQVIAANKIDAIYGEENEYIHELKNEFEPQGIKVIPISAVAKKNVNELLWHVNELLSTVENEAIIFEKEFFPMERVISNEPFSVYKEEEGIFIVEGPRIDRMLGYTNLESEKGFEFFQRFMKENGILDELEALGIVDGDTVKMSYLEFDYYK